MSRRGYLLGLGLALAFTHWALSLQPGVTEANVRRIRPSLPPSTLPSTRKAPDSSSPGRRWPRP
jgi:hypothetical protein